LKSWKPLWQNGRKIRGFRFIENEFPHAIFSLYDLPEARIIIDVLRMSKIITFFVISYFEFIKSVIRF